MNGEEDNNNDNGIPLAPHIPSSQRPQSPWYFSLFYFLTNGHHEPYSGNANHYPRFFPDLSSLEYMEVIKINTNNLKSIPHDLGKLEHVTELRLTGNIFCSYKHSIKHIPDSISKLHTLEILDLRGNSLEQIPHAVCTLVNLKELNMENCDIADLPTQMKNMKMLKRVILANNKIKCPDFTCLPDIDYLSVVNNGIIEISNFPQSLNLVTLDLSENFIMQLPETIFNQNSKLEKLYLRSNELEELPVSIVHAKKLKILDVSKNLLKKLPEDIGKLSSLKYFNISFNELTALPKSIINLEHIDQLLCGENPLQKPPIEVGLKGIKSIRKYFCALDAGPEIHNQRLKLMVLGEGRAGKTTLANIILTCTEPESDITETTIGIDFFHWKVDPMEDNLEVLIVDCAGQKKYMLTHQLFLSTGMLFAVVVDLNSYKASQSCFDDKIGTWINLIIARVPDAVILVVPTHLDLMNDLTTIKRKCEHIITSTHNHIKHWKDDGQQKKLEVHPNIDFCNLVLPTSYKIDFYGEIVTKEVVISNDSDRSINMIPVSKKNPLFGLKLLREEIIRIAKNKRLCPNVNHFVPQSWVKLEELCLKERQLRKKNPVITVDEIAKKAEGFKSHEDIIEALQYINSVGPILYFHSILNASNIVFLDPKWLLELLKLIFRHDGQDAFVYKDCYNKDPMNLFRTDFDKAKHNLLASALLSHSFLYCIWSEKISDMTLFKQVIGLFQKFDLAIDVELPAVDSPKNLLVPWYLKDHRPEELDNKLMDEKTQRIVTLLETNGVLPDGFFQRFIIKVYGLKIFQTCQPWNNGFVGSTEDGKLICKHYTVESSSFIEIVGLANLDRIYHLWTAIIPILNVLQSFIKEWKGICYRLYSLCPSCHKINADNPNSWRLDLSTIPKVQTVSCQFETEKCDKDLIYPPLGILLHFLDENVKEKVIQKDLKGTLTVQEKDSISGLIAHRCEELRRALNINEAMVTDNYMNVRERTLGIIELWEQRHPEASREVFITALHSMHPYPNETVNLLLLK